MTGGRAGGQRPPSLVAALVLVGVVAAAWVGTGAAVRASVSARTTADEPQYLLTAISLAEDGDLDIADERGARRYLPFHEVMLPVQTEARADGSRISPHDPLLPVLLAGPVAAGGWVAAKLALAALTGCLAATMVWVAVRRFDVPLGVAVATTAAFIAAPPLAVYGTQIYPELVAALVVMLVVAAVTGAPTAPATVAAGAGIVALPWLAVKYAPVGAALAAVAFVRLWKGGQRRRATGLLVGLAIAGAAYAAAHQAWYGGWTVYAAGDHFTAGELSVAGEEIDVIGRSRRLVGLLVDRSFGLVVWQPAILLAVPAIAALARRRPPGWDAVLLPLAAGWATAAFVALTMHGFWFPGRQVVVVIPLLAVAVAWMAARVGISVRPLALTAVAGASTFAALVAEGMLGRLTWITGFDGTVAPTVRLLRPLLPDYRDPSAAMWALHAGWTAVVAGLAVAGFWGLRGLNRSR